MNLSEESQSIRNSLGEFLQDIDFIDRRWVRLDSCFNSTFTPSGETQEIPCPVPAISDILGVRSTTANDYLIACGLLMLHPTHEQLVHTENHGKV